MGDSTAASIGVGVAALLLAFSTISPGRQIFTLGPIELSVIGTVAVVLLVTFLTRRYGVISRKVAPPIAGMAGIGVFLYGLWDIVNHGSGVGWNVISMALAIVATSMAVADGTNMTRAKLVPRIKHLGIGTLLGAGGLVIGGSFPLLMLWLASIFIEPSTEMLVGGSIILFGMGLVIVSVWFLVVTDRGISYVGLHWPDRWDVAYAFGGIVALLAVAVGIGIGFSIFNVPTAENTIEQTAETEGAEILLLAIPLAWIAIGFGEEFIFRGVIQPYLAEVFSMQSAILLTSVVFALVHIPAYYTPDALALTSVLGLIFGLSLILGWTYARTNNLLVPIFIHGTYNAIVFLAIYVSMTG